MCGIVGVAGNLTSTQDDILKTLLILDTIRGVDSTGIAAIDRNDDVRIAKTVGHAFDLMGMKVFDNALGRMNRAIIGHNRFATSGKISRASAHPFEFSNIVGVHNGTLFNKHKLLDNNFFTVDSENLYHHMNEQGLESLLEVMDGAWSLVWWDKKEETLNFLRNKERPMWYCRQEGNGILYWASEPWMLDVAIGRKDKIKCSEPESTMSDTLYSFKVSKTGEVEEPVLTEAKSKVIQYEYKQHQGSRNFHNGQSSSAGANSALNIQNQQTSSSNVVVFQKKKKGVQDPKRVASASTNLYDGRKNVSVEALALLTDRHGAEYIVCFDPENRGARIRLYLKRGDKADSMVGKELLVTVGKKYSDDKEGLYYKIEHNSVKLNTPEVSANNNEGRYFYDVQHRLIPKETWDALYGSCGMCTGYVDPNKVHAFLEGGGALCEDCSTDEEMLKYVRTV